MRSYHKVYKSLCKSSRTANLFVPTDRCRDSIKQIGRPRTVSPNWVTSNKTLGALPISGTPKSTPLQVAWTQNQPKDKTQNEHTHHLSLPLSTQFAEGTCSLNRATHSTTTQKIINYTRCCSCYTKNWNPFFAPIMSTARGQLWDIFVRRCSVVVIMWNLWFPICHCRVQNSEENQDTGLLDRGFEKVDVYAVDVGEAGWLEPWICSSYGERNWQIDRVWQIDRNWQNVLTIFTIIHWILYHNFTSILLQF